MDEESRAAAYRAQERGRFAFRAALSRVYRGDPAAYKGLYARMKAIAPPHDIGSVDLTETEDYIRGVVGEDQNHPLKEI